MEMLNQFKIPLNLFELECRSSISFYYLLLLFIRFISLIFDVKILGYESGQSRERLTDSADVLLSTPITPVHVAGHNGGEIKVFN